MQKKLYGEDLVFSTKKDISHEFEFALPEYLPNISRIVKTFAFVEKCDITTSGQNAFELGLKLGIVYVSDFGGKIKSAVFHESLSVPAGEELDKSEGAVMIPSAYVVSSASKPLGTRKFSLSCNCFLGISAYVQSENDMLQDSVEEKIHILTEKKSLCRKITLPETDFAEEVQVSLDSENTSAGEIIYADAVFCGADCRVNGSQIDFEGKFNLHILYEAEESEGSAETKYAIINAPVTVRESIESNLIKDGQTAYIYLDAMSAEPSLSFDPYGENKAISLSLKYKASPIVFENYEAELVTDAFYENCDALPEISKVNIDSFKNSISTTVKLSETIKGDIRDLSEISDCSAKILSVTMEYSHDKLFALARCRISIFGTNGQGELTSRDAVTVLHIPVISEYMNHSAVIPEIILCVNSCNAFIREGNIVAEPEISVKGIITERSNASVVTALNKNDAKKRNTSKNEIIICYPQKDDTLWGIAKKYGRNPESLRKANNLETNDIHSKHIMIIP